MAEMRRRLCKAGRAVKNSNARVRFALFACLRYIVGRKVLCFAERRHRRCVKSC